MEEILKLMKSRVKQVKKAIAKAEKEEKTFPEGRLRVSVSNNCPRYYFVNQNGDTSGKYLKKEERQLAEVLAQKSYNQQFLNQASYELSELERCISRLTKENADLAYQNLPKQRQILVTPYLMTDDLYAREWQTRTFKSNPYMTEKKIYDTKRGEKVRSKSEAIIADHLFELGIPYHYEKPLRLQQGIIRYPDFTLLKRRTREEIYLEHFGLLENEDYRSDSLRKLDEYRRNGIYIGKNLLFTYETQDNPLDINGIRQMLKTVL